MIKMSCKKLYFIGLFCLFVNFLNGERVKLDEEISLFLGTLERYASTPNDVVFLLDESGSIGADNFPAVKLFTELTVRRLSVSAEHSRVAIVTFATEPRTHVNHIKDSQGNNMCTLIKQISDIDYVGEWTHTLEAMVKAREILAQARRDSNKIIILVTDGESNSGHSPVAISEELKREGVIIFAVGVAKVNVKEIEAVATSLSHIYILKNFLYIVELNKYLIIDTKEVAWDLIKDTSMCNSVCTNGTDCCDKNANCYCGTRGGQYDCACIAGYFGTGHKGECYPCPKGTYKSEAGNSKCTDCPPHSTTLSDGSTRFADCQCEKGHETNGTACNPVKCASLSIPEGGILIPQVCENTYGSSCSFKCKVGFCPFSCNSTKVSSSDVFDPSVGNFPLPSRTCLENGKWSGDEFHCEKIRCPSLDYPLNGNHNCSAGDFTFGKTCLFNCDKGYELVGSGSRTCLLNGLWTGDQTKCQIVQCDPLKTSTNLFVKPKACATSPKPYKSVCQYYCAKGYNMTSGRDKTDGINHCLADKTWSGAKHKISCKDITPPNIICPRSINVTTDPHKPTAFLRWDPANATDNVIVSFLRIKHPKGIGKPPYAFPIDTTKIVYEAVDNSGISSTCSFSVTVRDIEPPQVVSCPDDIEVLHEKNTPIAVQWTEPVFKDNSGKYRTPVPNRKSGATFAWGPPFRVYYNVSDYSGNMATCSFLVKIKPTPCPYYEPPANGVLTCDNWVDRRLCSVFCNPGYEFAANLNVPKIYHCLTNKKNSKSVSKWVPFLAQDTVATKYKMPWPDCSKKQAPSSFNVSFEMNYTVDACNEEILWEMKQKFIANLKLNKPGISKMLCPPDKGCKPENVHISCSGATRSKRSVLSNNYPSSQNLRNRRQSGGILTVSFSIELDANTTEDGNKPDISRDQVIQNSTSLLKDIEEQITQNVKEIYKTEDVPPPQSQYNVIAICSSGQIQVNNSCVNCLPGTYKNDEEGICSECPTATYQDKEKGLSCLPCPKGYTTHQTKSKSADDCKAPCQPGTYSRTTFEPCLSCPLNSYQERSGSKDCIKCPEGLQTWRVGGSSVKDCVAPCKSGYYSDTGFEPCFACPVGTYQDKAQQKNCSTCPNGTSTRDKNSITIDDCVEIDQCEESHPCPELSTCINLGNNYKCLCPDGLIGPHCEINPDDCASDPCSNNGTCIDGIGNFTCLCPSGWAGHQCEINIDDCLPDPCENDAECVDLLNDYVCHCRPGYTGRNCETNIDECTSNPCANGGVCFDMENNYRCCCPKGFYGFNCDQEINICDEVKFSTSSCQNGGECVPTDESFKCSCPVGFEGEFCEIDIDDCATYACHNGGKCVDGFQEASCSCASRFTGPHCEEELFPEFVLHYPNPSTSNYVELTNERLLYAVTVSFYMRTNFQDPKSRATPLSYSYVENGIVIDNALTLLDTNRIVLYLHGEMIHTDYTANKDPNWHHYCVAWERKNGKWSFYVDGTVIVSGTGVGEKRYVWPGIFVLGQEQDSLGGTFSSTEAFQGDITEFNVWDYALTEEEIKRMSSSCGNVGNIIPWFTASKHIHGSVSLSKDVDLCKSIGHCSGNDCGCFYSNGTTALSVDTCKYLVQDCSSNPCANGQTCTSNGVDYFCKCSKGFEGRHCEYDVNECLEENGHCSFFCVNDNGSYHCECPQGMTLENDGLGCRDITFCEMNQKIYLDGETWVYSCQSCSCSQGYVDCVDLQCNLTTCYPEEDMIMLPGECCPTCVSWSLCLISPNNTITSFDASSFEFRGNCTYTIVEDCVQGHFKVQLEPSQNESIANTLVIYNDCMKVDITSQGDVFVNDDSVELPFTSESFLVELSNISINVQTHSGLQVQWHLTNEVIVAVPAEYADNMCGLCGRLSQHKTSSEGNYYFSESIASGGDECYGISSEDREIFDLKNTGNHANHRILNLSSLIFILLILYSLLN